jgi:hypothetical protein
MKKEVKCIESIPKGNDKHCYAKSYECKQENDDCECDE